MSDPRPLLAGVAGWPIGHSRSPILFEHWFRSLAIPGRYVPLAIAPEDFEAVYAALPKAGFRGINVTIPHKEAALALADERTAAAEAIGAANMIVFDPVRGRIADNTDAYGFRAALDAGAPGWPTDRPALVLGAGGAARAVIHALSEAGVPEIRIANRSRDRAEALATDRTTVVDWDARAEAADGAGLLVNTTSLGMVSKPPLAMPLDALPADAVVDDLVYVPLETPLMAAARARGLRAVDGLGMLLHQARPSFRAWFATDPAVDEALRQACLA
ncbi:MAG: shikimate dehydrogenase [Pseudomonadota bacterium]